MRKIVSSLILACFVLSTSPAVAKELTPADKRTEVADFELGDVKGKTFKLSAQCS